ncbi:Pentatricopeptide repeat [Dillenia turbinata]|uniref:Pentatricopeptide repeat n=1 Tax=Dillenia turbinata TaxID=194707 RepID=A0AAN8VZU9_9MAGN
MLSTTSLNSTRNHFLGRNRRWPHSPCKAKWHELFTRQLMQSASELPPTSNSNPNQPPHLLSSPINSFALYTYKPDPHAYNFVIKTLARNSQFNDLQLVLDHLQNVEDFEIPEFILTEVIKISGFLVKQKEGMDALGVLSQMKSDRNKPDVVCYTMVLDGVIECVDFEKAEELFDEMALLGQVPDVYTYNYINGPFIIDSLIRSGEVFDACGLFKDMSSKKLNPSSSTFDEILFRFCQQGLVNEAGVLPGEAVVRILAHGSGMGSSTSLMWMSSLFDSSSPHEGGLYTHAPVIGFSKQ